MLNDDYFTIHPVSSSLLSTYLRELSFRTHLQINTKSSPQVRSRSRATTLTGGGALDGDSRSRHSLAASNGNFEAEWRIENISDISTLMKVLRICRIDREKLEAVESFIKHGGEELHYLTEPEYMHGIMNHFIFQASRRVLLGRLMKEFEGFSEEGRDSEGDGGRDDEGNDEGENGNDRRKQRVKNLEAAVKAADEEVKRLEYWSDVRHMAEKGKSMGAVDDKKGWEGNWEGLDGSGPKEVKFDGDFMKGKDGNGIGGKDIGREIGKENRETISNGNANGNGRDKGKGRALE